MEIVATYGPPTMPDYDMERVKVNLVGFVNAPGRNRLEFLREVVEELEDEYNRQLHAAQNIRRTKPDPHWLDTPAMVDEGYSIRIATRRLWREMMKVLGVRC